MSKMSNDKTAVEVANDLQKLNLDVYAKTRDLISTLTVWLKALGNTAIENEEFYTRVKIAAVAMIIGYLRLNPIGKFKTSLSFLIRVLVKYLRNQWISYSTIVETDAMSSASIFETEAVYLDGVPCLRVVLPDGSLIHVRPPPIAGLSMSHGVKSVEMYKGEQLVPNKAIRPTGVEHPSWEVRIYSQGYVGMGIRLEDEMFLLPYHVWKTLDPKFKVKSSSRKSIEVSKASLKIYYESEDFDFILLQVPKAYFAQLGVSIPKIGVLRLDQRVRVNMCDEGTERGAVSEGEIIAPDDPLYDIENKPKCIHIYDASTVSGASGSGITQTTQQGNQELVAAHLGACGEFNALLELSLFSPAAKTLHHPRRITGETTSVSSTSSEGSDRSARLKYLAVEYAIENEKRARQRGEHRDGENAAYVDDEEWEETTFSKAIQLYDNDDEFHQNVKKKSGQPWMIKKNRLRKETTKKIRVVQEVEETEDLKVEQRKVAPLKEIGHISVGVPTQKVETTTESNQSKLPLSSSKSEPLTSSSPDQRKAQEEPTSTNSTKKSRRRRGSKTSQSSESQKEEEKQN